MAEISYSPKVFDWDYGANLSITTVDGDNTLPLPPEGTGIVLSNNNSGISDVVAGIIAPPTDNYRIWVMKNIDSQSHWMALMHEVVSVPAETRILLDNNLNYTLESNSITHLVYRQADSRWFRLAELAAI